jgi:hypothetical protein
VSILYSLHVLNDYYTPGTLVSTVSESPHLELTLTLKIYILLFGHHFTNEKS